MPTPSPASPVADTGAGRLPARDRSVITLLLVSAFVVILNETILSVALAPIMEDLHLQPTTAQWLTTAFMLTMAVVIPATGFLISRFTTRTLFTTAMSLFLVGTVICALSFSFTPLLLGRVVQATGTAIMMPLLMTTVMNLVPSRQRGRVMGNISIVISVAPALGPTISGLVLSVLPWRFLFVVVLPIALAALVMGRRRIEDVGETRPGRIDLLSLVLSGIGFGSLVYGLTGLGGGHGGETGGGSDTAAAFIGAGVLVLCVFIARQLRLQRTDEALLDLRTFASRNFAISTGLMVLMMGSLFGMIVLLPIYLQQVLDLPTLQVGLMLLPGGLIMGLAAPMVGRLYDRVGPRPLLVPGLALVGLGLLGLSTVGTDTSPLIILGAHIVVSIGLAHVFTPLFSTALGALTRNLYSHGSAIIGTIQQVAGGAGTAIMVSIMAAGTAAVTARGGSQAEGVAAGTSTAFIVAACLAGVAALVALLLRRNPADDEPDAAGEGTTPTPQ